MSFKKFYEQFIGDPPRGYIRIYRGVNPERNVVDGNDSTHGLWFTTTYEDAVGYANWDYEGTGELGPNRSILAVDVTLRDAFKYAKAGSRRSIESPDELLNDQKPVEMLVPRDVASRARVYEGDPVEGKRGLPPEE